MRSAASQVCQLDEGREVPRDIRAIHVRFERAEIDGMTGLAPSKVLFGQWVRTAIASSLSGNDFSRVLPGAWTRQLFP